MNFQYTSKQWTYLSNKWSKFIESHKECNAVQFNVIQRGNEPMWNITESFNETLLFDFTRSVITLNRSTNTNLLGILGVTLLDFSNPTVIITEGVSDFFTIKLLLPSCNVLGITNLKGNSLVKRFLITYFTTIVVVTDSDYTGIQTSLYYQSLFSAHNIRTKLYKPTRKDISQEVLLTNVNVRQKLLSLYGS